MTNTPQRVHALVTGRVQGVAFRASTQQMAIGLGLRGWVRNLADGRVEFCAEGTAEQLETMLDWARSGPPLARVDGIELTRLEATGEFNDFSVRR